MSISEERAVCYMRLCRDHVPTLMALEEEAYPDPWTLGMFTQEITGQSSHFFVMTQQEQIIGYGGFWLLLDEAHITKITVATLQRGLGYGQDMLEYLIMRARTLGAETMRLEVRASNTAAQRLYRRNGFTEVGVRKAYYARSGEDAIVMVKHLG